jgi:cytochrome c556
MNKKSGFVFALSALFVFAGAANADDNNGDENNQARYRHTVMESMGYSFGALAQIFSKRVDRPDELVVHARALATTSALTGGLFPEGSQGGDALPLIWEEPEKVAAASQELADTTAELARAAEGGNPAEIAKAFKAAGASCKGCHEKYKEEDE